MLSKLVVGILRRGELHHFNLVERSCWRMMPRVSQPPGPYSSPEHGVNAVYQRGSVSASKHLARVQVRERDLGGQDEHVARHTW